MENQLTLPKQWERSYQIILTLAEVIEHGKCKPGDRTGIVDLTAGVTHFLNELGFYYLASDESVVCQLRGVPFSLVGSYASPTGRGMRYPRVHVVPTRIRVVLTEAKLPVVLVALEAHIDSGEHQSDPSRWQQANKVLEGLHKHFEAKYRGVAAERIQGASDFLQPIYPQQSGTS